MEHHIDLGDPGWTRQADGLSPRLHVGDRYTIAWIYRRRTWWEWLRRRPRCLLVYVVKTET